MIDVTDMANWKEEQFSKDVILEIAKMSAVFFMNVPRHLLPEDVVVDALSVNILIANVLPESMITRQILERFGAESSELIRNAADSIFDAELSIKLVSENATLYPFINTEVLPREIVQEALAASPINIIYTHISHVDADMISHLGGVEKVSTYIPNLSADVQFLLCQADMSVLRTCKKLSAAHLLKLLPLARDDESKAFIMKKIAH